MTREKDFAPDEFVRNPTTITTKTPAAPGKSTLVDGYTGNPNYDKDPYCEREPGAPGCGLMDKPRGELLGSISRRCGMVAKNQQLAVMKCERDILAEKHEIDAIPAVLLGALGIALGNVITPIAMTALGAVGTAPQVSNVAALTRLPITFYSKKVENAWKGVPKNEMKMAMLTKVEASIDGIMERVYHHARENFSDEELKILNDALAPNLHTPQLYYESLSSMLKRLAQSGIKHIGRTSGPKRENAGWRDPSVAQEDTRVIWVRIGDRPVLFYQHVDATGETALTPDGLARQPERGMYGELADKESRLPKPTIGAPVETEFVMGAIDAHIAKWGPVIPTTLDPTMIDAARANMGLGKNVRNAPKDAQ